MRSNRASFEIVLPRQLNNFGRVVVTHEKVTFALAHNCEQTRVIHLPLGVKTPRCKRIRRVEIKGSILVRLVLCDQCKCIAFDERDFVFQTIDCANPLGERVCVPSRTQAASVFTLLHQSGSSSQNSTALNAITENGLKCLVRSEERRVGKECRSRWSP